MQTVTSTNSGCWHVVYSNSIIVHSGGHSSLCSAALPTTDADPYIGSGKCLVHTVCTFAHATLVWVRCTQ